MPVALESNRHSFYPIRFDFSTATVILPLLFLSFQLGLLSFLGFFQTFHETRLLHRLFLVFFQLGQQLIFVNRITENYVKVALSSIEGLTSKRRQLFFTFGKSM